MRYEVRLIATTESEIVLTVEGFDADADPDDVYDRAVQLLRDGDVLPGLDYAEHARSTEFGNNGVIALPDDEETDRE